MELAPAPHQLAQLARGSHMRIEENVPLHRHTTFRVGGNASHFCRVSNMDELRYACRFAVARELPIFVLGGGSNVVVSDRDFPGLVVKIELRGISYEEQNDGTVAVTAAAGEVWDDLVARTVSDGLHGLENLSNIPGTVGAAPIQNIGAYGSEVKDTIQSVEAYDCLADNVVVFKNRNCAFAYRDSFFKTKRGKNFIITKVNFSLFRSAPFLMGYKDVWEYFSQRGGTEPSLANMREAIIAIRSKKFPDMRTVGTAGSFFKNPIVSAKKTRELLKKYPKLPCFPTRFGTYKISLAWLLDRACGLRGVREGNVGMFSRQPLVIVNYGKQNANEIKMFSEKIKKETIKKIGITIEPEITFYNF